MYYDSKFPNSTWDNTHDHESIINVIEIRKSVDMISLIAVTEKA